MRDYKFHERSCIIEFIKLVGERDKMRDYKFHERSCIIESIKLVAKKL